ncbi:MAG TPA: 4Fe-4S dicluster domain-containing protein [Gemmatimonadota bacterium]|nr:4Fe-4S dicluster domain-containing protein [Gemmatimonadota bacterium]
MRYAFVIDQGRCIGCHACSVACKAEHDVPLGDYRTWVKYVEKGAFPDVRRFFTVLRCNHCEAAPCVEICPTTALYRRDDGIVDFDRDACIGCKACMQACPYDALYIHPDHGTAEKCNFCSHRIEIGLEPPCATVCPAEAILVGDLDDPSTRVAQIVATKKVDVRKPEKGTMPKVFYVDSEPRALVPGASSPAGGYLWADRGPGAAEMCTEVVGDPGNGSPVGAPHAGLGTSVGGGVVPAGGVPPSARVAEPPAAWLGSDLPPPAFAQAMTAEDYPDAEFFRGVWAGLAPARTTYDVAHARPWGWKVSGYLWTKSIAAGAFLAAAFAPSLGLPASRALTLGLPLAGLLFLGLTTALLVGDLKRPERFLSILWRPNWSSWLARGAFVLVAFGGLGTAWLLAAWAAPASGWLAWLRWPLVAAAVAGAGYSGYLFAQAKGRDFWQSPLLPLHFVVQAAVAGLAVVALFLVIIGDRGTVAGEVTGLAAGLLAGSLALHLAIVLFGEVGVTHPTRDAQRAARTLRTGALRPWFLAAIGIGSAAAALALAAALAGSVPAQSVALFAGGLVALAALWLWEHAWLRAGQCVPLS